MIVSSVILFEVNPAGVAVLEFEGDAPWSVHVDRIARRSEAPQSMEIKARDDHFRWHRRGIQAIQTTKNALEGPSDHWHVSQVRSRRNGGSAGISHQLPELFLIIVRLPTIPKLVFSTAHQFSSLAAVRIGTAVDWLHSPSKLLRSCRGLVALRSLRLREGRS